MRKGSEYHGPTTHWSAGSGATVSVYMPSTISRLTVSHRPRRSRNVVRIPRTTRPSSHQARSVFP